MKTKYIVWVKENRDGPWQPNGDGPMTEKQAQAVADEVRRYCGCPARAHVDGYDPNPIGKETA